MDTLGSLEELVKNYCEERDWSKFHNPKDLAIGLSTESNELLDLFRFKDIAQMDEMLKDLEKRNAIGEELADIFFFLLRFSNMYDFDLNACLRKKMIENAEKYPVEKVKGKNLKYNEYK